MSRKRKPVTMELISHEPTRVATFKKRKCCILKKAKELSILCSVPVCVIVSDGTKNSKPETWPQESNLASEIISKFKSLSQSEQTKKMLDKNSFVSKQITKLQAQLRKIERENQDLNARLLLKNLVSGNCSIGDVQDEEMMARLRKMLEMKHREVEKRREKLLSAQVIHEAPLLDASVEKEEMKFDLSGLEEKKEMPLLTEDEPAEKEEMKFGLPWLEEKKEAESSNILPAPLVMVDESVEKEEMDFDFGFGFDFEFDLSWLDEKKEMPLLAESENSNFVDSLFDWCKIDKEMSESLGTVS